MVIYVTADVHSLTSFKEVYSSVKGKNLYPGIREIIFLYYIQHSK